MVKYLAWYINGKRTCKGGSYRVNLVDEIEKFKKKNPNTQPIVLFDLLACLTIFISNDVEVLCGGRQTECTRKAKFICEKFRSLGCKLVFFMDGPMRLDKIPHWMIKVNEKYERHKLVFEQIKKNIPLSEIKSNHILTAYNNNLIRTIKQYGEFKICLDNECDIELAEYATKNHAAGLFTNDTDYLITFGDWPIWSTKDFNFDDFSTIAWNKKVLRKSLNLEKQQLPIFATLAGNDYVEYDVVKPFLENITKGERGFTKLTQYIRKEFPKGYASLEQINRLVSEIYKYHKDIPNSIIKNEEELKDKFFKSLNFYNYKKIKHYELSPSWLKTHIDDTASTVIYVLMKNLPFIIRQNYIDLSNPDVRAFYELCLPILQRLMGIVFYNRRDKEVKRKIYYKPSHNEPFQEKLVEPEFPPSTLKIPTLINLLGYGNNRITDEEKFNILSWVVSCGRKKLNVSDLIQICDSIYFLPAITLNYLVKSMQITRDEADIILLAIHETSKSSDEKMINLKPPEKVDERPFWISFVYGQIIYYFMNSITICGLYKYLTNDYYDGYVFHKMYPKYLSMDSVQRNEILEPIQKYRLYMK